MKFFVVVVCINAAKHECLQVWLLVDFLVVCLFVSCLAAGVDMVWGLRDQPTGGTRLYLVIKVWKSEPPSGDKLDQTCFGALLS